jgi:ABC-type oligopeptide transport system substrate-binding subunit
MRKKIVFLIKIWKELNLNEKILISAGIVLGVFLLILPVWIFVQNNFEKLPAEGGILREGLYQPINALNPFLAINSSERALVNLIFDKLIIDDGQGNFLYELGKSITEFDKGLKFLVELRDDRLWSNGEKITSDDLIFSFETLKKYGSDEVKNLFRDIEVEKIDNYQTFFNLKIRDNYFYNKLNQLYIVPKSVWQKFDQSDWQGQEDKLLTVVSGPYAIEKKSADEIIFVKNKFYEPKPYIKKIVFKIYTDLQTAIDGLRTRQIDAVGGVPSNILKSILSRRLKVTRTVLPRTIGVFFNNKEASSINVSDLARLVDREKIKREIFDGEAEIADGIFSQSIRKILNLSPEQSLSLAQGQRQLDKLTEPIEIVVPQNYFFQKIAGWLAEKIPLEIRTEAIEDIYTDILQSRKYQAIILGISYNLPPNLSPFFLENSSFNLINLSTQTITGLLQKLSIEQLHPDDYRKTLEKLEAEIKQTGRVIFIANPYYLYVLPKNLKTANLTILRQPEERFAKIELWYLKTKIKWQ